MTPHADYVARFADVRHIDADGVWAGAALGRLTMARLAAPAIDQVMAEALQIVGDSGEGPEELFGDPRLWAEERAAEASQQGATFVDDDSTLPDAVAVALLLAGVVALVGFTISAIKGRWQQDWSIALTVLPIGIALVTTLGLTLREWLVHRMPAVMAMAATLCVVVVPSAMGLGWLALRGGSLGTHSSLWWLAQATLWFGLAWLSGRVLPDRGPRPVRASTLTDDQWLAEARTKLRERGDLTEAQVSQTLAEARDHADQAGTRLAEEFGNPVGYVRTLPGSELTRRRRTALWWCCLAALSWWLALDHDGPPSSLWWRVVLAAAATLLAGRGIVRWQRIRSVAKPRPQP